MLIKYILFCFVTGIECMFGRSDDSVVLTISPNDFVNTFKNLVKSDYIRGLANEFAAKAAEHIINTMREQDQMNKMPTMKKENDNVDYRSPTKFTTPAPPILNEEEAMVLLEAPSPDGDNLEKVTDHFSEEEQSTKKETVPVIGLMKINGQYFRRLLGFIYT